MIIVSARLSLGVSMVAIGDSNAAVASSIQNFDQLQVLNVASLHICDREHCAGLHMVMRFRLHVKVNIIIC